MAKLSKEQALTGLQKLHALTRETSSLTRKKLQDACGLRLTDMIVLSENGIISCTSRRPARWDWKKDVVPTMEMAEKMLKTKVKVWYNRPDAVNNEGAVHPGPIPIYTGRVPGVKVYKKYEITKKYGDYAFTMTLEENGGGWKHALTEGIVTGPCSADKLKAIGFALVTAAEIIEKESAK